MAYYSQFFLITVSCGIVIHQKVCAIKSQHESALCLRWQHVFLFFRCPLKQLGVATQHVVEARLTHMCSGATLQLRRLPDFFRETCAVLC